MSKKNKINKQTRLELSKRIEELERENKELAERLELAEKVSKILADDNRDLINGISDKVSEISSLRSENLELRSQIFKNNIFLGFAGFFSLISLISRIF